MDNNAITIQNSPISLNQHFLETPAFFRIQNAITSILKRINVKLLLSARELVISNDSPKWRWLVVDIYLTSSEEAK